MGSGVTLEILERADMRKNFALIRTGSPEERRVMRGGSYLCHANHGNRDRTDARSSSTPDSSTTDLGTRGLRDREA